MTIYTETTINKIYRLIEIQKEIDLFNEEYPYSTDIKIVNVINDHKEEIKDINESLDLIFGFKLKIDNVNEIINDIESISECKRELQLMYKSWESEDSCDMACNDPGLQYEKEEFLNNMISNFKNKYQYK